MATTGGFTSAGLTLTLNPTTITSTVHSKSTFSIQWDIAAITIDNTEWLAVKFPESFIDFSKLDSTTTIELNAPVVAANYYWIEEDSMLYVQPGVSVTGTITLTFNNLPNAPYASSGTPTIQAWAIDANSIKRDASGTFASYSITPVTTAISNIKINPSSLYARRNDISYGIQFTLLHDVPESGSVVIAFPLNSYNLAYSNPTCEFISGLPAIATCVVESSNVQQMRVKLNGEGVSSGTTISLNINDLNNPVDASAAIDINIETYEDAATGSSKKIASTTKSLTGQFLSTPIVACDVSVVPSITTVGARAIYTFSIGCTSSIRNNTQVILQFPGTYTIGNLNSFKCEVEQRDILIEDCAFVSPTINIGLRVRKPVNDLSFDIKIHNVLNPISPVTYTGFDVQLFKNQIEYAEAAGTTSLTLTERTTLTTATNNLALNIFPRNGGEKAFYFFKIESVALKKDAYTVEVQFPDSYNAYLGEPIVCGIFDPSTKYAMNYARNFETINGYQQLTCSVTATRTVQLAKPRVSGSRQVFYRASTNGASTTAFFFIRNVYNPNLFTPASLMFNVRMLDAQNLIYHSSSTASIAFTQPPGPLVLSSLTSSDENIRAKSSYQFTLQSFVPLPEANDPSSKQYELWLQLPEDFSHSFDGYVNEMVIPEISSTYTTAPLTSVNAFNWNRELFIYTQKSRTPAMTSFSFTLGNMTNPNTESFCIADDSSWEADMNIRMDLAYASRPLSMLIAKTFTSTGLNNCLDNFKNKFEVTIEGNRILQRGLIHKLRARLEGPAEQLTLRPFGPFLFFEPTEHTFTSFDSSEFTFNVTVSDTAPAGRYSMNWHKQEDNSDGNDAFLEIQNIEYFILEVSDADEQVAKPTATFAPFKTLYVGAESIVRFINLTASPVSDITIEFGLENADTGILVAVETEDSFSNLPIVVKFSKGEIAKKVFIRAQRSASNNVLHFTFGGTNVDAFNAFIPSIPYIVKERSIVSNFKVVSISASELTENMAKVRFQISDIGYVYYLVTPKMKVNITAEQLLANQPISNFGQQIMDQKEAFDVAIEDIHFCEIDVSQLRSQSSYNVFAVAKNLYGDVSEVHNITFRTDRAAPGVKMSFITLREVAASRWIHALSTILRLPTSRVTTTNTSSLTGRRLLQNSQDLDIYGFLPFTNEVVIRPSLTANSPTPKELADKLLETEQLRKLTSLIPELESSDPVRIDELRDNPPYVITNAQVLDRDYYNVTVGLEIGRLGKIFATITEKNDGTLEPYSEQIYYGYLANNTVVDSRKHAKVVTNANGDANLTFEELKDNKHYVIHITAGKQSSIRPS